MHSPEEEWNLDGTLYESKRILMTILRTQWRMKLRGTKTLTMVDYIKRGEIYIKELRNGARTGADFFILFIINTTTSLPD